MENFSLEKIDTSKDSGFNFLFLIAIALFFIGPIIAFSYGTPISLAIGSVLFGFSLVIYFYIFQRSPVTRYFQYFWINEKGIHHVESSALNSRVTVIGWNEIKLVECLQDDEGLWKLNIFTSRLGFDGVPLSLSMNSGEDAIRAGKIAHQWLEARA